MMPLLPVISTVRVSALEPHALRAERSYHEYIEY